MKFSFRHSMRWSIFISALTFVLAAFFSVTSTIVLEGVVWGMGVLVIMVLVLIGIVFDMMGIASAAAKEVPFHSMAAEKVPGARHAIYITRNADRFSSFCNDVIGDIVGVISGTATAIVVIKLMSQGGQGSALWYTVVSVVFSATVSAIMVGGKALGKSYAIHNSNRIVLVIGKVFYVLERRFRLKIFKQRNGKKDQPAHGKRGNKRAARSNK